MGMFGGLIGDPFSSMMGGGDGGNTGNTSGDSGGIGNSKSSNTTQNTDNRLAVGDGGQTIAIPGTVSNLTLSDMGAISAGSATASKALELAIMGMEQANKTAQTALVSTGGIMAGVTSSNADTMSTYASSIEKVKTSDVRTLIYAGLGVIGLAAVMMFGKKA
jgi:hypothetical protein